MFVMLMKNLPKTEVESDTSLKVQEAKRRYGSSIQS